MVSAVIKNISNNILKVGKEADEFKSQNSIIKCSPIYLCYETEQQDLLKAKNANISIFKAPCQSITGFNIHPDFTPDCYKKALHIEFYMYSPFDYEKPIKTYGWLVSGEFSNEIKDEDPGDGPCVEINKYLI